MLAASLNAFFCASPIYGSAEDFTYLLDFTFRCTREGGYRCETVLEPLDIVANAEKTVPRAWINADGNGLEQPFIDYVLPLIQGVPRAPQEHSLPRYARLKKVLVSDLQDACRQS